MFDLRFSFFSRQQSQHLGLTNATIESTDQQLAVDSLANETTPIIENKQSTNLSMPINPTSVLKYEYEYANVNATAHTSSMQSNNVSSMSDVTMSSQTNLLLADTSITSSSVLNVGTMFNTNQTDFHRRKRSVSSISPSSINDSSATIATIQSTIAKSSVHISDSISNSKARLPQKASNNRQTKMDKSSTVSKKNPNNAIIGRISVLIHNISVISNADKDYAEQHSDKEWTNEVLRYMKIVDFKIILRIF